MSVCTDNRAWARALLPASSIGEFEPCTALPVEPAVLGAILGADRTLHCAALTDPALQHWTILARDSAPRSQYDSLIERVREQPLPDRLACLARTGTGFHGFRNRAWSAAPGNLHLTVHFAPGRPIERLHTVFTVLAAAAVVEAIDGVAGLQGAARIKWVNDVLLDGAKVAGVLAYTQTRGDTVASVILGIGLNVETTPTVERSPWVPAAGSLRDAAPDPTAVAADRVLHDLLSALDRLYDRLLAEGNAPLVALYRARSAIVGREVRVLSDDASREPQLIAAGRVTAIGEGLELHIEGHAEPITRGRLVLGATGGVS